MKYFVRLCLLLTFCLPLATLFAIMIATHGDDAADEMVTVLDRWLNS